VVVVVEGMVEEVVVVVEVVVEVEVVVARSCNVGTAQLMVGSVEKQILHRVRLRENIPYAIPFARRKQDLPC
jgi:hypothetical protein